VSFAFGANGVTQVPVSPETEISRQYSNHVVCRAQPGVTGSRIPEKPLCLARWQWEDKARKAKLEHWRLPALPGGGGKGSSK
jgi:hypothetical protein